MIEVAMGSLSPGGDARRSSRAKLGQWICLWSIPFFYNLFGLVFLLLARLMPPPSPGLSTGQIVDFIASNRFNLQLAMVILSLSLGLSAFTNGLVFTQMRRMEGTGTVLPYAYLGSLAVAALPGCMFCSILFSVAAFRPDRDPQLVAMLYDFGLVSFVGCLGCFAVQYIVFAIAVFLDKRSIFPKWLGYMTVWNVVTELLAAPVWIFKSGVFAWDGFIAFYMGTVIWIVWQFSQTLCLYRAIRSQREVELLAIDARAGA